MAPQLTFYGHTYAPNPMKIMILLEELNIEYRFVPKEFGEGPNGVRHSVFIKICPSGRVPALVDHTNNDLTIWESGAILLYLAERFDTEKRISATSINERAELWQWLFYEVSGLSPSEGQALWFTLFHSVKPPELHPSVLEHYQNETRRIFGVLDKRLSETNGWIALDRFTIVDIAHYPWLHIVDVPKLDFEGFPHLKAYVERLDVLPCVQKAYARAKAASS